MLSRRKGMEFRTRTGRIRPAQKRWQPESSMRVSSCSSKVVETRDLTAISAMLLSLPYREENRSEISCSCFLIPPKCLAMAVYSSRLKGYCTSFLKLSWRSTLFCHKFSRPTSSPPKKKRMWALSPRMRWTVGWTQHGKSFRTRLQPMFAYVRSFKTNQSLHLRKSDSRPL